MKQNKTNRWFKFYSKSINFKLLMSHNEFLTKHNWNYNIIN